MRNRIFAVALGALLAAVVYMSARPADSFKFNTSADALYLAPEAQDEFESKAAASEALRTPGTTDYTGPVLETYTFDLQPGSYTFTLYASADAGSGVFELYSPRYANDDNTPNRVLVSAPIEQGYEATALTLKTAEVVRGARLRIVRTDVKGSIEPYSISGDGGAAYSDALTLAVLTALFTIWAVSYYHRRREELRRGEFGASAAALCCILTAVISTAPIARYALVNGHDLVFHLTRIEGVYEGLLSGQFPVRLNPTFLNGYGYADAIMYPTLFLYFPAALRLL
ncbi:MAG: hypothetical protein LBN99_01740, partial [Oscillospiraceae bacterium]|nr:hypothetical protein [Oscillospiraceae bacterium]